MIITGAKCSIASTTDCNECTIAFNCVASEADEKNCVNPSVRIDAVVTNTVNSNVLTVIQTSERQVRRRRLLLIRCIHLAVLPVKSQCFCDNILFAFSRFVSRGCYVFA